MYYIYFCLILLQFPLLRLFGFYFHEYPLEIIPDKLNNNANQDFIELNEEFTKLSAKVPKHLKYLKFSK